jgi:antitoxin StbD
VLFYGLIKFIINNINLCAAYRCMLVTISGATPMQTLFAETSIGITDLKKNPSAVIRDAGDNTVVVLHHNKASAYLVPAKTYEVMMDIFDDLMLAPLIQLRLDAANEQPEDLVEVSIAQLEREAKAKIKRQA